MDSPCIGICRIEAGRCVGCHRSISRVARWAYMSEGEREAVMTALTEAFGPGPDPGVLRHRPDPIDAALRSRAGAEPTTVLHRAAVPGSALQPDRVSGTRTQPAPSADTA